MKKPLVIKVSWFFVIGIGGVVVGWVEWIVLLCIVGIGKWERWWFGVGRAKVFKRIEIGSFNFRRCMVRI